MTDSGASKPGAATTVQRYKPYTGPKLSGPRTVLELNQAGYPSSLIATPQPPKRLFCIGNIEALRDGIGVVGARKATPYGLACTRKFASIAAERGVTIVSGGARGCDSEAHRAALAVGARTVVVLGGGCDQLYPTRHYRLFQQIIDSGGVVISEHEWEHPALPWTFRMRNRIIAGLSRAVLIVEASLPSGTFSTADEALSANRDVFVVPGAITSPTSAGSNQLLFQGAMPVVDAESFDEMVCRTFGIPYTQGEASKKHGNPYQEVAAKDAPRDFVLEALLAEPMRMDDLVRKIAEYMPGEGDSLPFIHQKLAELQRDKAIVRYPDGRFGPTKA